MRVAEAIVKIMENEGVTDVFGIPGAGINPVYKYLADSHTITHYTMRHEEAATHAADAYYRASGRMSVALCTSGPGATNFITGLYTAYADSIPFIAITGQCATSMFGKEAFQYVDIVAMAKPVAKAAWCITKAEDAPRIMREAFRTAREGRPGPVLIDLPLDVQMAEIEYDMEKDAPLPLPVVSPDRDQITKAVELLRQAKAPVMIMGGGVVLSNAVKDSIEFAEFMRLPVITTYMAKGGMPVNHPLNAGHMGTQVGTPLGNRIFLESDVVLGIGCRFGDRHTGDLKVYVGDRKFIHIDIDPGQINRIVKADIGIVSDAKLALQALLDEARTTGPRQKASERVRDIPRLREALKRKTNYSENPMKPQRVFHEMNKFFFLADKKTIFTTGCGLAQIWSGQLQEVGEPRHYLPSGGAGTLGFDIPAAIGAKIAKPDHNVVAVLGDFGFTFMVEELAVAAAQKIPIIVVIVNNAYLGLIRQGQKYGLQFEYGVSMEENQTEIDYVKVAEGFGCRAERITDPEEISAALERAVLSRKPTVIDIIVERDTDCSMGPSIAAVREFSEEVAHSLVTA